MSDVRRSAARRAAVCVLAGWLATAIPGAHDFSQSESALEISGRTVRARIRINLLEMAGVDANVDQRVSYEELDRSIERVFEAIKQHYQLRSPAAARQITAEHYEIGDDHVLQIVVVHEFDRDVRRVEVTSAFDSLFAPSHQHLVSVVVDGESQRAVLDARNRTASFEFRRTNMDNILMTAAAAIGLLLLMVYRTRSRAARR
jgi:hypothetical protein